MDLARRSFDPFNLLTMPALTNISGMNMDQGNQMFASDRWKISAAVSAIRRGLDQLSRVRKLAEKNSRRRR